MILGLADSNFAHNKTKYSSGYTVAKYNIEWDRSCNQDKVVFTDRKLLTSLRPEYQQKKKYAWLIEPREINDGWQFAKKNQHFFEKIFTHEPDEFENGELVILGGCWIYKKDQKCYYKTKLCSIVASPNNYLEGHKMRHYLIGDLSKMGHEIDVYGRAYNPIDYKLDTLKDYKYQIVIENVRRKNWFTEKLIDCFATGTIPIYWGCPNIGEFFDERGIVQVSSFEELLGVIGNLDSIKHVEPKILLNNLIESRKYNCAEDQIYHVINN